jgi:COMPASS component SWD2
LNCCGKLLLSHPYLAAFDPSANVIAIASEAAQTILLYDYRHYDKEPFATFDLLEHSNAIAPNTIIRNWNKLEFSNDGKSILVGTTGHGHLLLDAFEGHLKAYLHRPRGGPKRLAAGEHNAEDAAEPLLESSGDACFSPDGRYVLSGSRRENVLVWDTLMPPQNRKLAPIHELEMKSEAAVLAFNPRYNFFATADKEVVFWVPDPHADS